MRGDTASLESDDDIIAKITVDPNLANYKDILPLDWVKTFSGSLRQTPALEEAGLRLVFQWKAITSVADFPSTAMHIFSAFADGLLREQPIANVAEPIAKSFASTILRRAPKLARQSIFKGSLGHAMRETTRKLESTFGAALATVTPEQTWTTFIGEKEFRFRVWSCLQTASVAAFNAYEGFLAAPLPPRVGREGFDERAKKYYGEKLHQRLLHTHVIDVATQLRHAISHNQGRCTDKLNSFKHGLATHDGLISVYPGDLRRFIKAMGEAAAELVTVMANGQTPETK